MLRKYRPRTPDPFLGVIQGDNEVARLAHINDLVDILTKMIPSYVDDAAATTAGLIAGDVYINTTTDSLRAIQP